jgi:hypothetical protein
MLLTRSRWFMSWREPRSVRRAGPAPPMHTIGDARALGVGEGGHHVGDARARGDGAHPGLARHARPAVGGVARGLLVAHVHHADAHVEAAVVDVLDVAAAEGEEVRHALALELLGYESVRHVPSSSSVTFGAEVGRRRYNNSQPRRGARLDALRQQD